MNAASELHALTGAYAVDALDELERARFERHLAECPDCADEVRSLTEAASLLSTTVATTPPPALKGRVLDEIRTVRVLPPESAPVEAVRRKARRFPRLVAAAAAALVVAGGVGIAIDQQQGAGNGPVVADAPVSQQVLDASDARSQSLTFDDGSKATLTHSKSVNRAVLVTDGMAAAPTGKAYELWFRKDGRLVSAGLMTSAGDTTKLLSGQVGDADWVGITVEPDSGSEQPTTTPIAQFDLSKAV